MYMCMYVHMSVCMYVHACIVSHVEVGVYRYSTFNIIISMLYNCIRCLQIQCKII